MKQKLYMRRTSWLPTQLRRPTINVKSSVDEITDAKQM